MSSGPGDYSTEQAESLAFLMSNPAISTYISKTPAVSQLLYNVPGAAVAAAGFVAMNPYLYVTPVMYGGDSSAITSGPAGTYYMTSSGGGIDDITVTGSNPFIPKDGESIAKSSEIIPKDGESIAKSSEIKPKYGESIAKSSEIKPKDGTTSGPSGTYTLKSSGYGQGIITVKKSSDPYDVFATVEPVLIPLSKYDYPFTTVSDAKTFLDSKVAILNTPGLLESGEYSKATRDIFDVMKSLYPVIQNLSPDDVKYVQLYILLTKLRLQILYCEARVVERKLLRNSYMSDILYYQPGFSGTYFRTEKLFSTYIVSTAYTATKEPKFVTIGLLLKALDVLSKPDISYVTVVSASKVISMKEKYTQEQIDSLSPDPEPKLSEKIDKDISDYIKIITPRINEFINQNEMLSGVSFITPIMSTISSNMNRVKNDLRSVNNSFTKGNKVLIENIKAIFRPKVIDALTMYVTKLNDFYRKLFTLRDTLNKSIASKSDPDTVVKSLQSDFSTLANTASPTYSKAVNNIYNATIAYAYNLISIGSNDKAQELIQTVINQISTSNGATGATQHGGNTSGPTISLSSIIDNLKELKNTIGTGNPSGPSSSSTNLLADIVDETIVVDTTAVVLDSFAGPSGPSGPSGSVRVIPGFTVSGAQPSGAQPSGAQPSGADLSGADLSGADLSGADPSGASGADPSGASGADLSGFPLDFSNRLIVPAPLPQPLFVSQESFYRPVVKIITNALNPPAPPPPPPPPTDDGYYGEGGGKRKNSKRKTRRRLKARK